MDHPHKTGRQNGSLHKTDEGQGDHFSEHRRPQADPDARLTEDDLPLFADFAVGIEQPHKTGHRRQNKEDGTAANINQVGGKAVRVAHQRNDPDHERGLQQKAGQHKLVVKDQLEIAGDEHPQLAEKSA